MLFLAGQSSEPKPPASSPQKAETNTVRPAGGRNLQGSIKCLSPKRTDLPLLAEILFYSQCILRRWWPGQWELMQAAGEGNFSTSPARGINNFPDNETDTRADCHCGAGSFLHGAPLCLGIITVPLSSLLALAGISHRFAAHHHQLGSPLAKCGRGSMCTCAAGCQAAGGCT